jgi:hypothetical protein
MRRARWVILGIVLAGVGAACRDFDALFGPDAGEPDRDLAAPSDDLATPAFDLSTDDIDRFDMVDSGLPCGDANGDGKFNVSDQFYLINYLNAGGAAPIGNADVDGNGALNNDDVQYMVENLFAGGPPPMCR